VEAELEAARQRAATALFASHRTLPAIVEAGVEGRQGTIVGDGDAARLSLGCYHVFGGDPRYGPDLMREIDLSCYAGSAVFLSTAPDLVRFGMAINGGKLLKPETVQLLEAPQRTTSGAETGYGLGWDLETATINGKQTPVVGHDGDLLGGMMSSLMTFTEQGIVVSVTSNTSYAVCLMMVGTQKLLR